MIARVLGGGRSFKGSISYNVTGKNGRARLAWMEFHNLPTRSPQVAWCMMAATASTSVSNTKEPVYHFSVSCDPDDPVDREALRRIAGRTIHDLGLQEYEVAVFCHNDRSHPHLHFVANRVHPERGTLWSKWRDRYRFEHSMRAQERELGLRVVPGWLAPVPGEAEITRGGKEAAARKPRPAPVRGDAAFLQDVIDRATPSVEGAQSWAELDRRLAEQGLSLFVKGGGFRITDGRRQVKASEVGRAFSRRNLEKRFGSYPDYRTRMAAASAVVRATPVATRSNEQPHDVLPSPVPALALELPRPASDPRIGTGREPQIEFLRAPSAPAAEEIGAIVERGPEPQPVNRDRRFLREVKKQATPVLAGAQSWAELERALDGLGLSLHVKGGGFVISDGQREAKASDVGRAFSRKNLEKRFGGYPDYRARVAVADFPNFHGPELVGGIAAPPVEPAPEQMPVSEEPAESRSDASVPRESFSVAAAPAPVTSWRHGAGQPAEQLSLPFASPPLPPPWQTRELVETDQGDGSEQLHLLLGDTPGSASSRVEKVNQPASAPPAGRPAEARAQAQPSPASNSPAAPPTLVNSAIPPLQPAGVSLAAPAPSRAPAPEVLPAAQPRLPHVDRSTPATPDPVKPAPFPRDPTVPPAEQAPARAPALDVAPAVQLVPQVTSPVSPQPAECAPAHTEPAVRPELRLASDLSREALDWHKAESVEHATREAMVAAAQRLDDLRKLAQIAADNATTLRNALDRVFVDPYAAATELHRYEQTHGLRETRRALQATPDRFGTLRGPRFVGRAWYTLGGGRKDVDGILQPLENAVRSDRQKPSKEELAGAEIRKRETVDAHIAAREARQARRFAADCKKAAAELLRPLLVEISPEVIAKLLAALMPPDDQEGAQLAVQIVELAVALSQSIKFTRGPARQGIEF